MDKEKYLYELETALHEAGKSGHYILACLNYATRLINCNLPVIFDLRHLALLIGIEPSDLGKILYLSDIYLYRKTTIPKKSGGERNLLIPSISLKYIQSWILNNILYNIPISQEANGFCKGKSIVSNAEKHLGKECLVNIDIKDFFPTISIKQVFRIFIYYGYTKELSYILAKLCTFEGRLPQGSPASPYISNIVSLKLDKRLSKLSVKYNADYSRYADDITFSGPKNLKNILPIAEKIINEEGFIINESKTRISYRHQRQSVTGLIVNGQEVKISKYFKRQLQSEIYFCKKFGVSEHQKRCNDNHNFYKEHIYGKAYFVNMVEPELAKRLLAQLDEIDWDY